MPSCSCVYIQISDVKKPAGMRYFSEGIFVYADNTAVGCHQGVVDTGEFPLVALSRTASFCCIGEVAWNLYQTTVSLFFFFGSGITKVTSTAANFSRIVILGEALHLAVTVEA